MNLYLAKVIWYDSESHPGPATDYLTLTAENHTNAMAILEDCFRDTIETAEITLLNSQGPYLFMDKEIYDGLLERGFC